MRTGEKPVKVWDAPVRLFHWLLVLLFAFMFFTGKAGSEWTQWHMRAGYALLTLVLFRVFWGFAGGTHARFSDFLAGPAACLQCVKDLMARRSWPRPGHNPLGGWMVVVLLVGLLAQAGTGLFSNDDVLWEGPLASLVSKAMSDRLTTFHSWNFNLLLALAGTHIAAVLYHAGFLKENLVAAMFTGVKNVPAATPDAPVRFASPWRALVLLVVAAVAVALIVNRPF